MNTKIISHIPPTIVQTPNGRWAVSGSTWIPIGPNVTLDEVRSWWERPISPRKPNTEQYPNKVWSVVSSNGKSMYMVTHENGKWNL